MKACDRSIYKIATNQNVTDGAKMSHMYERDHSAAAVFNKCSSSAPTSQEVLGAHPHQTSAPHASGSAAVRGVRARRTPPRQLYNRVEARSEY